MFNHGNNGSNDRGGQKVDIRSVLADSLRGAEYVAKGTSAEKGCDVPPKSVRSRFNRLNDDVDLVLKRGMEWRKNPVVKDATGHHNEDASRTGLSFLSVVDPNRKPTASEKDGGIIRNSVPEINIRSVPSKGTYKPTKTEF